MNAGEKYKLLLRKFRREFISTLQDPEHIIEQLRSEDILNTRQYQILTSEKIQIDKISKLLDFVEVSGEKGFKIFLTSLSEEYAWLKTALENEYLRFDQSNENTSSIIRKNEPKGNCLSEKALLNVSKQLMPGEWELLALELGFSNAEVEACKTVSNLCILQAQEMLVKWKRKNGDNATDILLKQSLYECDLTNISM